MGSASQRLEGFLRGKDPRALEEVDRAFRAPLVRYCEGWLGARADAEDAVQEVFRRLVRQEAPPERLRAWLYAVARNHCLNVRRGRARRPDDAPLPDDAALVASVTGPLSRLAREEERERVAALLRRLPEEQREVLRLRYTEGLSRDEVAEVLGIGVGLVKSRLFEGMKKIRDFTASLREDRT